MSHTVTVTRTTTTTSTSAILLNIGYFKTVPGILKLAHIILGVICVALVGHYISFHKYNYNYRTVQPDHLLFVPELFFLLIATTCLITSALLLFACIVSIATATILPKTVFEVVYHAVAAVLLLLAAIIYTVEVNRSYYAYSKVTAHTARLVAGETTFLSPLVFLLFLASVILIKNVVEPEQIYANTDLPSVPGYGAKVTAGILGIINAILYAIATVFAYRNFRSG